MEPANRPGCERCGTNEGDIFEVTFAFQRQHSIPVRPRDSRYCMHCLPGAILANGKHVTIHRAPE